MGPLSRVSRPFSAAVLLFAGNIAARLFLGKVSCVHPFQDVGRLPLMSPHHLDRLSQLPPGWCIKGAIDEAVQLLLHDPQLMVQS